MVDIQDIIEAAEAALGELAGAALQDGAALRDDKLFLVEVKGRGDEFEVVIDSDERVMVDDCIRMSKAIEGRFDREVPENDFSLTVSSAGIGQPLRVARQYRKLTGRPVEVLLANGTKIVGTLEAAGMASGSRGRDNESRGNESRGNESRGNESRGNESDGGNGVEVESITLSYPEKQKVEGKKRPEIVTVTRTFPLAEVKATSEHIDFK